MIHLGENKGQDNELFITVGNEIGHWVTILEVLKSPYVVRTPQVEAAYGYAKKHIAQLEQKMEEIWDKAGDKGS